MAAIETIRIKDIPTTATTAAADDYIVIDGATNKVRKGLASNLITATAAASTAAHNADAGAHGGELRMHRAMSVIGSDLRQAVRSFRIASLTDSTGDDATDWPYLTASALATRFPKYNVSVSRFDKTIDGWRFPVQLQVGTAGRRHILMGTNGFASLAHSSFQTPTGIQQYDIECTGVDWTVTGSKVLMSKMGGAGNFGVRWMVNASSQTYFSFSSNGTSLTDVYANATLPAPSDGLILRVWFNPDNGSGSYEVKFYTSTNGANWTQLGTTRTGPASTVYNSTSNWSFANVTGARLYRARLCTGASLVSQWPEYIDGFSMTTATAEGANELFWQIGGWSGATTDTWADATRLNRAAFDPYASVAFVDLGHNHSTDTGTVWTGKLDTLLTALRGRFTGNILFMTQNPRLPVAAYYLQQGSRMATLPGWCAKNGVHFLDVGYYWSMEDYTALTEADGVHPTEAGQRLWASIIGLAIA